MTHYVPPNPFPNGKGFSVVGAAILLLFTTMVGGLVIYGIKLLGDMIP